MNTARAGRAAAARIPFGPVPSRRLGRSLGVNNIPPKHCTYSCVYCQVGRTTSMETRRRVFHPSGEVASAVASRVAECRRTGRGIDVVTFVPDGEPTLDLDLGPTLRALMPLGIPLAVITNGSLLARPDVRSDLGVADIVSVKIDTVDERTWHRIDRPSGALRLPVVLDGIRRFAEEFGGRLITETMLVRGLNDGPASVEGVARFLETIAPDAAYLAVPTRPPAESGVEAPDPASLAASCELLAARLPRVILLTEDEEGPFGQVGPPIPDLLAILAVHPMREEEARRYLTEAGAGAEVLDDLLAHGTVARVVHDGRVFLVPAPRRSRVTRGAGGGAP